MGGVAEARSHIQHGCGRVAVYYPAEMSAILTPLILLAVGFGPQVGKAQKPAPFVPTKLTITYYIDDKGTLLKPQRKHEIADKATIQKFQKMFQEAFDRTKGSEPAGWRAGTWLRFEDDKGRSREIGFNYKFDRWSWGKGDFAATKEMKTEVWKFFGKAKPI